MTIDLNYILKREQISLERAISSRSPGARKAHKGLARAYGELPASTSFPHNALQTDAERKVLRETRARDERSAEAWESEGGATVPSG